MSKDDKQQEYLETIKSIQESILKFLEEETNCEENLTFLKDIFNDLEIQDNRIEFMSVLHLISKIANNFHRSCNFFSKIEQILQYLKADIKKNISNSEIFNIFQGNKRILLFLAEEGIMTFDEYVIRKITMTNKLVEANYPQYFQPEIEPFMQEQWFPRYNFHNCVQTQNEWVYELKEEVPENFYAKRKKGENDDTLCEMIRNDMVEDFIAYVTRSNTSLDATIQLSIFETNPFLIKKQTEKQQIQYYGEKEAKQRGITLIEYAVFFGSIQIYNYLRLEKVQLTPSLWNFAVHGKNADLIHSLEDCHVSLEGGAYMQLFYESIKCHHNDIANYFLSNFLQKEEENLQKAFIKSLRYYNFAFLNDEQINESSFYDLCKYDYSALIGSFVTSTAIDINKKEIFPQFAHVISYARIFTSFQVACFNKIWNHMFQ